MPDLRRESPVRFDQSIRETVVRDHWTIPLEYEHEGNGPWVIDLTHTIRWDLQDGKIDALRPCDLTIPASPGRCTLNNTTVINRMKSTQASIYHLGPKTTRLPDHPGYTEVSDATVLLALLGPNIFFVAEKLTHLDFMDRAKQEPFLLQGPFCSVTCQIVILERHANGAGGFLLTCSRGYGASLVTAIMAAGSEFGLQPAGENRFQAWIQTLHE